MQGSQPHSMRSVFLWRMLVMLILMLLIASLLVTGGYMYLSRDAYISIKLEELSPKAEAVSQLLEEYAAGNVTRGAFMRLADEQLRAADSTAIIADASGAALYQTVDVEGSQAYRDSLEAQLQDALAGRSSQHDDIRTPDGKRALSICLPVKNDAGGVIGAVFLLKSAAEIDTTTYRLNRSLLLALAVVLPVMLLAASFGVRRLADPLHEMAQVASAMGEGDFNVRANENETGEVGMLARALNRLCDTLSQAIYQLRAEKSQLNQILFSFSEGIAAIDSLGVLTHYNPALMRMFGSVRVSTRSDLISDPVVWDAFDAVFRSGEAASMRYQLPGDRMLWITISPVVTETGERTGVVGLFKDMSEMERLERTRREYVANVSHELRTPLTAVRGLLEPLADGLVTDEADRQRYYRIMLKEVVRLSRLITDMLQLSRLQAGTEYMELVEVDINEILSDVRQSYAQEAAQHGITLNLEAPALPHVVTDPDRIEQILVILLDNAIRYTPEGGTVTIAGEDGPRVAVSVRDTGVGIPEKDIPHVFDRFYKVDKSRKEGGTGLGLSIARNIIQKLGETISVESKPGFGTTFRFSIKKYVSNAIALGPPSDDWDAVTLPPIVQSPDVKAEENHPEDAPYEVLPQQEKEKKPERKKPGRTKQS